MLLWHVHISHQVCILVWSHTQSTNPPFYVSYHLHTSFLCFTVSVFNHRKRIIMELVLLVPHIMILLSWFSSAVTDPIGLDQSVWSSPSGSSSDIKRSSAQPPGWSEWDSFWGWTPPLMTMSSLSNGYSVSWKQPPCTVWGTNVSVNDRKSLWISLFYNH